ncbi:MAG: hypothetical protein IJH12_02705 [Clostridia bacterium]|nr:hypothetical protein [Clostridia bacterium]
MYKNIERDNKIFTSKEFLKDKYKFNIVTKILTGDEVLLYSDEENYFFARNRQGKPTWIWTKDGLKDEKILEEIKETISLYLTDLEYDQFTCKKEFYDYLIKTNYEKLNTDDYFELGFLICNEVKDVKNVDGNMQLATKDEIDIISEFVYKFLCFMKITLKENDEVTFEKARKETEELIEKELLYTWKNKDGKIVCIAKYDVVNGTARIGHVYTLEEERGKGYAANLIHDLTILILSKNIQPLLYTDYSYPASNKAYINAGYEDEGILINFSCSRDKNNIK